MDWLLYDNGLRLERVKTTFDSFKDRPNRPLVSQSEIASKKQFSYNKSAGYREHVSRDLYFIFVFFSLKSILNIFLVVTLDQLGYNFTSFS